VAKFAKLVGFLILVILTIVTVFAVIGFGHSLVSGGLLFWVVVAALGVWLFKLHVRVNALEIALARGEERAEVPASAPATPVFTSPAAQPAAPTTITEREQKPAPHEVVWPEATTTSTPTQPPPPKGPSLLDHAKAWLFGGNTVARFGLLILFLGLIFLAKYAVDNDLFPIEARLAVIGVIALGMLAFGWRLRDSRASYGLMLQGGAVAALYLEIFAAFKFYALLSSPIAFVLMILVCALATFLALRQNALVLAVVATLGGFLTPVLASTGSGNYVALFSIYAVLNLSIFAIARLRPWRVLYLLGFVLTFGVTGWWVMDSYKPSDLQNCIGFIALFIALYSLIPVLEARRSTPNIKHYVDGSLVFGTPTIGFGLLAKLLSHLEYGLAFAALALGAWYLALAAFGLKKQVTLAEQSGVDTANVSGLKSAFVSYIALGMGFASLAVPLALEPRLAGVAWAFEGAALIWLGLRAQQPFTRFSGIVLQALGLFIFLSKGEAEQGATAFFNPYWLGATMLAVAAFWSGYLYLHRERAHVAGDDPGLPIGNAFARAWLPLEKFLPTALGLLGSALVIVSNTVEFDRLFGAASYRLAAFLGLWTLLAFIYAVAGKRLKWPLLLWLAPLVLPIQVLIDLYQWMALHASFADYRWLAWPVSLGVTAWVLYQQEKADKPALLNPLWTAAFSVLSWVVVTLLLQAVQWQVMRLVQDPAWAIAAVGVSLSLVLAFLVRKDWSAMVPGLQGMGQHLASSLRSYVPLGLAWLLGLWFVFACIFDFGGTAIRPFVPLLNPIDLSASLALLTLLLYSRSSNFIGLTTIAPRSMQLALAGAAFLLLNTLLMRALSHYLQLPYQLSSLINSSTAQTSFSLLWATTATAIMFFSTRRAWRSGWLTGAGLLAVVVLKLFLVDLSSISTLTRIVSFVGVGLLMLLIGYLSPLPPAAKKSANIDASTS
jgi:uncharacterized membrane protein